MAWPGLSRCGLRSWSFSANARVLFGAAVVVAIRNDLSTFGAWTTIIQGVIVVVCIMVLREGIGIIGGAMKENYDGSL